MAGSEWKIVEAPAVVADGAANPTDVDPSTVDDESQCRPSTFVARYAEPRESGQRFPVPDTTADQELPN